MGKDRIVEDGEDIGELSDSGFEEGYMCRTDYNFEVGRALGGNRVFKSIEDLKKEQPCSDECGIVKVKVVYVETINAGKI